MEEKQQYLKRFNSHCNRIEAELAKGFSSSVPLINEICSHSLLGEGKRLRPLLFVLSALMCGYEKDNIYRVSTMFEFIHSASLLHDDVIDNADIRRKKPSVSSLWGNSAAVLTGDFMFSMAFNTAVESDSLSILSIAYKAALRMTEGQIKELICTRKWNLSEEEYLDIITSKTAELISVCCEAGAAAAGADKKTTAALKHFGLNMGIAFQMIDDLLDYSSSGQELGKPAGKDFREGKITLPLIYAIPGMKEEEIKWFKALLSEGSKKEKDYQDLITTVRNSGSIEKTKARAKGYVEVAARHLMDVSASDNRDNLLFLNEYLLERLF
ncbi:MAG: polyprenyl synthetase family protein [Deltaproteobacteria bacterium]|nr:polyprenyl synthetase family protein [Deltaproteobacteria bacterium]